MRSPSDRSHRHEVRAAAGVPIETPEEFADFQSRRGVSISDLVGAGSSIKAVQALARHPTPGFTPVVYAKARPEAVAGLPDHDSNPAAQGRRPGDGSGPCRRSQARSTTTPPGPRWSRGRP